VRFGIEPRNSTLARRSDGHLLLHRHDVRISTTCSDATDALAHLGFGPETYVEVKYADQAAADRDLIAARLRALSSETGIPAVLLDETIIRADRW